MASPGEIICMRFEGLHKVKKDGLVYPYICPAGYPTQGYGVVVPSMDVPPITVDEAERRFFTLFAKFRAHTLALIKPAIRPRLTLNQLEALTCFAYNLGLGRLKASTLLRKVNRGEFEDAADEFMKWDKARVNGVLKPLAGLTKRRRAERELFLS